MAYLDIQLNSLDAPQGKFIRSSTAAASDPTQTSYSMSILDVIQIFLVPDVSSSDRNTISGRIWHATQEYILHLDYVTEIYTSFGDNQIGLFIVWQHESNREKFYDTSLGVGIMKAFMRKPPVVFSLRNHARIFDGESFGVQIIKCPLESLERLPEARQAWIESIRPCAAFCAFQVQDVNVCKPGEDELKNIALLNLLNAPDPQVISSTILNERTYANLPTLADSPTHIDMSLQTLVHQRLEEYPDASTVDMPQSTPQLLHTPPWLYGVLPWDKSEYSDAAYPHGLSFRPMYTLAYSSWFRHNSDTEVDPEPPHCHIDIISLSFNCPSWDRDTQVFIDISKEICTHSGIAQLQWCNESNNEYSVRFWIVWENESTSQTFKQCLSDRKFPILSHWITTSPEYHIASFSSRYPPGWGSNETTELLEFTFPTGIGPNERQILDQLIYDFLNPMQIFMSDMGEETVVEPYGPFWIEKSSGGTCLVLLQWDGLPQRRAYFQNFLANGYDVSGHLAHKLSLACPEVRSTMIVMHKIDHYGFVAQAKVGKGEAAGSLEKFSDEEDMGF